MRIDGPSISLRYLNEDDADIALTAIQGFWPDGTTPSNREVARFKWASVNSNINMFDRHTLTPNDFADCVYAVCLQNDTVIGYNITVYDKTKMISAMSAIIPEYRYYGYYRELVYLRHRLGFDVLGATESQMKMPTEGDSAIKTVLDGLYDETLDTFKFQEAMWRWGRLSEAHYRAYLEANPDIDSIAWSCDW